MGVLAWTRGVPPPALKGAAGDHGSHGDPSGGYGGDDSGYGGGYGEEPGGYGGYGTLGQQHQHAKLVPADEGTLLPDGSRPASRSLIAVPCGRLQLSELGQPAPLPPTAAAVAAEPGSVRRGGLFGVRRRRRLEAAAKAAPDAAAGDGLTVRGAIGAFGAGGVVLLLAAAATAVGAAVAAAMALACTALRAAAAPRGGLPPLRA